MRADVVVVGAGVVGAACAEHLAATGLDVAVVDDGGMSPSAVSGGLVRGFVPGSAMWWSLRGFEAYRSWSGRPDRPSVRGCGSVVLLPDGAAARSELRRFRGMGGEAEMLGPQELGLRFPGLTVGPGTVGVVEQTGGWLPARETVAAMLAAASGARTVRGRATAVLTDGAGRVGGLATTAGTVTAGAVVLAAGTGSSALAATAGVELPLRARAVGYGVFAPPTGGDDVRLPAVVDTRTGAWLRPWTDGGAVLAGVASSATAAPPVVSGRIEPSELRRIRPVVAGLDRRLDAAPVIAGVSAFDAESPSRTGSVISWPDPHGLVAATGWNGGGFKLAPAVGEHVAALVRAALGRRVARAAPAVPA